MSTMPLQLAPVYKHLITIATHTGRVRRELKLFLQMIIELLWYNSLPSVANKRAKNCDGTWYIIRVTQSPIQSPMIIWTGIAIDFLEHPSSKNIRRKYLKTSQQSSTARLLLCLGDCRVTYHGQVSAHDTWESTKPSDEFTAFTLLNCQHKIWSWITKLLEGL